MQHWVRDQRMCAHGRKHGSHENAEESEILSQQDTAGGAGLSLAAAEEQRQDNDVVDIGGDEQPNCLRNGGQDHALTSATSLQSPTVQAGSMHGAASSTARVVFTSAVSARVRCGSAIS